MSSVQLLAEAGVDREMRSSVPTLIHWAETRRASIVLFNVNGEILYVSRSVRKLLDPQDSLKGRRIGEIFDIISCDKIEESENEAHHVTIRFTDSPQSPLMDGLLILGETSSLLDLGWHCKKGDIDLHPDQTEPLAEFMAQIAHEIRNPLAGIGTTIDILAQESEGDNLKYCMLLKSEVGRVANLLKNLMHWSAPADRCQGKCSFQDTLERCLNLIKIVARIQDVSITQEIDETPMLVHLSEAKLTSVLQNVIMNAMESMVDGGLLSIDACMANPPRMVRIVVSDTGSGIESEDLESVFNPFWSKRKGGTGLGLAVTKRYITEAGGEIQIRSTKGEGTQVEIHLPLHDDSGT